MGRCRTTDEAERTRDRTSLAKALAPEEIRRGDFVTPLYVISQWPSWYWDEDDALHPREQPVCICSTPQCEAEPLKVRSICLPFVLVQTPAGAERTLDVRTYRLARLDRGFAGASWRAYRKAGKRAKKALTKGR